jgi:D-threo-aldose 1-dehydrogenase
VRYFDTAPLYGYGRSEQHLGETLGPLTRTEFAVSTKAGRLLKPGLEADPLFKGTPELHPHFDFSAAAISESLASSRDRLGMERFDIVFVHDPDDYIDDVRSTAHPALAALRRDGAVGAIGVGTMHTETVLRLLEHVDLDCFLLAGRYTLLEQDAAPLLAAAAEDGISVIAGGVFNSGLLIDPVASSTYDYEQAPRSIVRRAQRIREICAQFGVPLRAAALQFPSAHRAVASVVVGARSPAEVDDCIAMSQVVIPPELWAALKEHELITPDASVPGGETR